MCAVDDHSSRSRQAGRYTGRGGLTDGRDGGQAGSEDGEHLFIVSLTK